jgi:hypothetical protein
MGRVTVIVAAKGNLKYVQAKTKLICERRYK